jgi:hypothetical protein
MNASFPAVFIISNDERLRSTISANRITLSKPRLTSSIAPLPLVQHLAPHHKTLSGAESLISKFEENLTDWLCNYQRTRVVVHVLISAALPFDTRFLSLGSRFDRQHLSIELSSSHRGYRDLQYVARCVFVCSLRFTKCWSKMHICHSSLSAIHSLIYILNTLLAENSIYDHIGTCPVKLISFAFYEQFYWSSFVSVSLNSESDHALSRDAKLEAAYSQLSKPSAPMKTHVEKSSSNKKVRYTHDTKYAELLTDPTVTPILKSCMVFLGSQTSTTQ